MGANECVHDRSPRKCLHVLEEVRAGAQARFDLASFPDQKKVCANGMRICDHDQLAHHAPFPRELELQVARFRAPEAFASDYVIELIAVHDAGVHMSESRDPQDGRSDLQKRFARIVWSGH